MNEADGEDRRDEYSPVDGESEATDDADGGFVFGPEQQPAPEEASSASADDDPRIRVDLEEQSADSTPPERDPGRSPGAPDPSPNGSRNWTVLLVSLAVVSFASAVAIATAYEEMTAAAGASLLGAGFLSIAVAGRTKFPALFGHLETAWAEHRLYVWFSTGLFTLGILAGIALYAAGIDLMDLFLELIQEEFGGEMPGEGAPGEQEQFDLSATFFITNNTPPFLLSIFGTLLVGLVPFAIMVFNGILVGNIAAVVGAETGVAVIITLLAPHGMFELPALFIAAGVGFRFLHRIGQRLAGTREALFTRNYLTRTVAFVIVGWLILVLAAFVEAYVTLLIADALFETGAP